jgi:hypothetical protein
VKVPLLDLKPQYKALKKELDDTLIRIAESQYFILGPEVDKMEKAFNEYMGCKYSRVYLEQMRAYCSGQRYRPEMKLSFLTHS